MSLKDTLSNLELKELEQMFEDLKNKGVLDSYNLESGHVKIKSTISLIRRMETHVFSAFKIAFPNRIIRKTAIDIYLAALLNSYTKMGLSKETALVSMLISLEKEKEEKFPALPAFLGKEFSHFDFEEIKTH